MRNMKLSCAVCKKQSNPDGCRSVHQFPNESNLRKKWMDLLELTSVKKTWGVCSDHFSPTSFHEKTGFNNKRRRLLSNAVPNKPPEILSEILNNILPSKSDVFSKISNPDFEDGKQKKLLEEMQFMKNCNKTSESSSLLTSSDLTNEVDNTQRKCDAENCNLILSKETNSSESSPLLSSSDSKRKRLVADTGVRRTKKFCFKDGYAMKCISRADFVSDEAWNKFLKFTILKEKQLKAYRKNVHRKEKKIGNFKELVATLNDGQHSAVAQYLQVHCSSKYSSF